MSLYAKIAGVAQKKSLMQRAYTAMRIVDYALKNRGYRTQNSSFMPIK